MQAELKEFWLFPFDQADRSWLSGLDSGGDPELLRHARIRGRVNLNLMERFQIGVAFRAIPDPLLHRLALLDGRATRRLARLAALCLARRFLQQAIDREHRRWVLEVVGDDMGFVVRRAALLWCEEEENIVTAASSAPDLQASLVFLGFSAFASILNNACDPEVSSRLLLRFPTNLARSDVSGSTHQPLPLRRLFEKLIDL